jgi:hypothetical protein
MIAGRPVSLRRRALEFAAERLRSTGFVVEDAPPGLRAELLLSEDRQTYLVKLLATAAPHRLGPRGSIGLHWMLPETPAELVALVDLSRSRLWLLPAADFKRLAQPVSGGRFHLDWIVVHLSNARTRIRDEDYFEAYEVGE